MSTRRKKIVKLCEHLYKHYSEDFVGWVDQFISFEGLEHKGLTAQQAEIYGHLRDKQSVCVSAGGGIGKTAFAALLILWFLSTHPHSKIPTTAPNGYQLRDVLWAEISKWLHRCALKDIFDERSGILRIKGTKDWFAVARTVPKKQQELNDTLAGFHAPFVLIVVDEASGVPNQVFTALEGIRTNEHSYVLLISNPVSTGGYYYDTIHDPDGRGKDYEVLFYDSRESPLVTKEYENRIIARYGKDHPMYRAKVLGLPIEQSDSICVTPSRFDKITLVNTERHVGEVILSCDVGGETGKDPSVILHRIGFSCVEWEEYQSADEDFLYNHLVQQATVRYKGKRVVVIVDAIGIGAGLHSRLRNLNMFPVAGFVGSARSNHLNMYANLRSEHYHKLHKQFDSLHFPVPVPKTLKKELANVIFSFEGPIATEAKEKLKAKLGHSPDSADVLAMSFYVDPEISKQQAANVPNSAATIFSSLMRPPSRGGDTKFSRFIIR